METHDLEPISWRADDHDERVVNTKVMHPASFGLGLCDTAALSTPEQNRARQQDLAALAANRRQRPVTFDTELIN